MLNDILACIVIFLLAVGLGVAPFVNVNAARAWLWCRRECGATDYAFYTCQRAQCPGRLAWEQSLERFTD